MDRAPVAVHLEADRDHAWLRGRLTVIRAVLRRALPPGAHRLLELGCGSGNVLEALAEFGEAVGMAGEPDDDAATLRAAHATLAPDGTLVATAPAYAWLWSGHDVALGHRRRYTTGRLRARMTAAGFTVTHLSYFNALLLPALVAVRAWKRLRGDGEHRPDMAAGGPQRRPGVGVRSGGCARARVRMPAGASLLLVARR